MIRALFLISILGGWAGAEESESRRLEAFEAKLFSEDDSVLLPFFKEGINQQLGGVAVEQRVPLVLRYLQQVRSRPNVFGTPGYDRAVQEGLFLEALVREAGRRAMPLAPELLRLAQDPENWAYLRGKYADLLWILQADDPALIDQMKEWVREGEMRVALEAARSLAKTANPERSMVDAIEARIVNDEVQTQLIEHAASIELRLKPMSPSDAVRMLAQPESHRLVRLGAAIRSLDETDPDRDADVLTRYRTYLIALGKHEDFRIKSLVSRSLRALPPIESRDIALRVLDLMSEKRSDVAGTLKKIRPFPPDLINRTAELLAAPGTPHSWAVDRDLMEALGSSGPRAAIALPELLRRYEADEGQILGRENDESPDGTPVVINWTLFETCISTLVDIGPGDVRVHDILLRRLVPGAPVFDRWAGKLIRPDHRQSQSLHLTRLLREAERLSWPNRAARHRDLYALSRDLVSNPADYAFRAGCEMLTNIGAALTVEQVERVLPPMEKALAIELEPLGEDRIGTHGQITVLKALEAFGPKARPALETVRKISQKPVPSPSFANHRLIEIFQQARRTEAAILGE